ncbi:hypothetical protein Pla52o_15360 [Novipirellula galeiformis]|uniref:Uncharacterized protein n=1 Tax=Novipirellula galeiformis TaxID=2528004 RepID=A0A5C6CLA8_9BACT|nr:hypothetical protein Pla52o_15360 [Novipirellula galeiformis]
MPRRKPLWIAPRRTNYWAELTAPVLNCHPLIGSGTAEAILIRNGSELDTFIVATFARRWIRSGLHALASVATKKWEAIRKRHLVDGAGLNLSNASYRLGPTLQFDATTETFVDSPETNQLLG